MTDKTTTALAAAAAGATAAPALRRVEATSGWQPGAGRRQRVRFQAPVLPTLDQIAVYYAAAESERWYSNGGPNAQLLQRRVAAYVGQGVGAVLVNNATAGLMVALRAVAGQPDAVRRYVIVPSYTFVATVNAISWCGFEPLFCDVSARTWHADVSSIGKGLQRWRGQVAALLLCSTFGTAPEPHERQAWESLAAFARVPLVVDSAAGFGATDSGGTRLGAVGDAEVFSFHATKPFAIGEGGAITTRSTEVAARCARLANFGFDADRAVNDDIGLNAKLSELHAATGLAALDGYGAVLASRRQSAAKMIDALSPLGFRAQDGHRTSTFQFVPVLSPSEAIRDAAVAEAASRGIELRTYYRDPLHTLAPYRSAPRCDDLTVTSELAARCLSLPMANDLSADAIDAIVATCAEVAPPAHGPVAA